MRLKEAYIENFGKLHKETVTFAPGINVICGENEAGKSTLQEFLTAMLFGMELKRGRSKDDDVYRKYEPWNAASYYCGTLRFEVDGKPFCLKRNFYHKEKTAKLTNEADGEELSVEFGDLSMLLGDLSRSAYLNTWCICQTGAVTGKELADLLREYLTNVENTGDASVSFAGAKKNLERRKKEIQKEKKELEQEKERRLEELRLEEKLLSEDIRSIEEQHNREKVKHDLIMQGLLRNESLEGQKQKSRKGNYTPSVILGTAAVLHLILFGQYELAVWRIVEAVLLFGTLLFAWFSYRKERRESREQNRESNGAVEYMRRQQEEMHRYRALEQTFLEQKGDKELRRSNVREAFEEVSQKNGRESEIEKKVQAVLLAEQTLEQLSGTVSQEVRENLYASASQVLSGITGNRYERLRFDDAMQVTVFSGEQEIPVSSLSRGTIEQVYLAVRIAAGEVLGEEPMFFSFDETFAMYDEERLASTLHYINKKSNQVLIFTCTTREIKILEKNRIPYHKIMLGTATG